MKRIPRIIVFWIIIFICFGIGVYKLSDIPGDWYGDISIVHEYVQSILSGTFPWQYSLSSGPLYHYLIAPGIFLLGHSYFSYKLMSVLVGMFGVAATYLLASEFVGGNWALVTAFISGTSFWYLAWERTGNSQILIIPVTALTVWCAMRWWRTGRTRYAAGGTVVSLLGLFIYPQTWVLPIIFLLLTLSEHKKLSFTRDAPWVISAMTVFGVLWFIVVMRSGSVFGSGYIGAKIWPAFRDSPVSVITTFGRYFVKTALMLHIHGDALFRVNVPGTAQLDIVSGMLFLIGLIRSCTKKERARSVFLWLSIFSLILPSLSPVLPPGEVPSSGRTIAILPFVMILVTVGMVGIRDLLQRWRWAWQICALCLLAVLFSLNFYKYFVLYPKSLPNGNRPYARIVSRYVDTLPQQTPVYMASCCWGAWGQPEPKAVYYQLQHPAGRGNLLAVQKLQCSDVTEKITRGYYRQSHGYCLGKPH